MNFLRILTSHWLGLVQLDGTAFLDQVYMQADPLFLVDRTDALEDNLHVTVVSEKILRCLDDVQEQGVLECARGLRALR
jgi:hypothetical protein